MAVIGLLLIAVLAILAPVAQSQTFQRLGACPTLGCVFPPDLLASGFRIPTRLVSILTSSRLRTDFLAGQFFDIRLEVHAPVNGSEANGGKADPNFTFTVARKGIAAKSASAFFNAPEPKLEIWNFTWNEGMRICASCTGFRCQTDV
jgi:hypothetical protein